MAKQFTVTNRDGSTKTLSYTAKASKYARLNNMTIPQIQAAKKIVAGKLAAGNLDPLLNNKLTDLANQYEQTEREINKYYQKYATDPRVKHLIAGKKNSLTIAKINQKDYPTRVKGKEEGLRYRKRDMILDALSSKFTLGIGITALGLGVAGQITSAVFGKSIMTLLAELVKMMALNNPAALAAIAGGAALIVACKAIPAIRNKVHNFQNKKLQLNKIQNELTGESEKDIDQFDAELLHENSFDDKNRKILVNSMYNDPANVLGSLGISVPGGNLFRIENAADVQFIIDQIKYNRELTPSQKTNLIQVVKDTAKKTKEAMKNENADTMEEGEKEGEKEGGEKPTPKKDPAVAEVSYDLSKVICDISASSGGTIPSTPEELITSIQTLYPTLDPKEVEKIATQLANQLANSREKKATGIEMGADGPTK